MFDTPRNGGGKEGSNCLTRGMAASHSPRPRSSVAITIAGRVRIAVELAVYAVGGVRCVQLIIAVPMRRNASEWQKKLRTDESGGCGWHLQNVGI
jgi:hypothetical protein